MSEQKLPDTLTPAEEQNAVATAAPAAVPEVQGENPLAQPALNPVTSALETAVAAMAQPAPEPPVQAKGPAPRTPAQKAAAVLALLDDKTLEQLAGRFPDRHRERLIENVKALRSVRVDEQQKIAREFAARIEAERDALRANDETVSRLSSTLFITEPPAFSIADNLGDAFAPEDLPIWERVAQKPISDLVAFFAARPATVFSVALANLPNDISSEIAGELPEDLVKDTMILVAEGTKLNPLAVEAVEKLLEETLLSLEDDGGGGDPSKNIDTIASMLNRMVSSRRESVMAALKANMDADAIALLDTKVLSIATLEDRVPRNAIPILFREIDEVSIMKALKYTQGTNPDTVDYLLRNISQRLATTFKDRMEGMASPPELEGEKAQSAMICKILALADEGRIELLDPPPVDA